MILFALLISALPAAAVARPDPATPRLRPMEGPTPWLQGRRVRSLLNERLAAGPHEKVWNGRDGRGRQVPSGVYFYRFAAGEQQLKGKLTLLK